MSKGRLDHRVSLPSAASQLRVGAWCGPGRRAAALVLCLVLGVLGSVCEAFGQAAMPPGWRNPGWMGNPAPAPIRVPKPAPRPYRGYWTEVGYQWWGFGEGACHALHFLGDVGYGGIQCAGYGAGWLASLPGWVDDPAALVPPNPGTWQSGGITGYDQRCKGGEGAAATCEMAINCATLGVLPICQGLAEDLTTGSNNTMQCLGGQFAGAPAAAGIGAVVRPVLPRPGMGRIPVPGIGEPAAPPIVRPARIVVTEELIREATKTACFNSQQVAVSIPRIQRYVDWLLQGREGPPINIDKGMIVDGNHRYIAHLICNKNCPTRDWLGGRPSRLVPWDQIRLDPHVWPD